MREGRGCALGHLSGSEKHTPIQGMAGVCRVTTRCRAGGEAAVRFASAAGRQKDEGGRAFPLPPPLGLPARPCNRLSMVRDTAQTESATLREGAMTPDREDAAWED